MGRAVQVLKVLKVLIRSPRYRAREAGARVAPGLRCCLRDFVVVGWLSPSPPIARSLSI
jgi:hypothetical protein